MGVILEEKNRLERHHSICLLLMEYWFQRFDMRNRFYMFDFLFGVSEEIRVINKNPLHDLKYRGFLFNKKAVRTGLELNF